MPVFQNITVTNQAGGSIIDDFDVVINQLDGPGGSITGTVTYNSITDTEVFWNNGTSILKIETAFGEDENLSGTITLRFNLNSQLCEETVNFNPEFVICSPDAAGANEDFAFFVFNAASEQAQIEDSGVDCLLFQVN